MERRVIGNADEFYRLRVMRVDESDSPDLVWRDDILWRRPPVDHISEGEVYRVEAVELDNEDALAPLAAFGSQDEAYAWLETAETDLAEMTKSEFEQTYFPDTQGPADEDDA
jgi:hypothetical protein